jgi:hypothetical protein
MYSRSLFCFLLVVTTVARGGQQSHPEIRWAQRERMHVPGNGRVSPLHPALELDAHDAHLRWLQTVPARPNSQEITASRVTPATFRTVPGQISISPGGALSARQLDRELSLKDAARTNAVCARTSQLAPFDTVYETGYYGDRIHAFSYERGHLSQRLTMRRINGSWYVDEGYIYSYRSSGLLAKRTTFWDNNPLRKYTESYQYDREERVVSYRSESFDGITDTPRYWRFDTTTYNAHGEEVCRRNESWSGSNQTDGYESIVTSTDTSTVRTEAGFQRGEWVNTDRYIFSVSAENRRHIFWLQSWNGKTWINTWMTVTIDDEEVRPTHSSTYQWQNDTWLELGRRSYSYSTSGYSTDYEVWNGMAWAPGWQERVTNDARGRELMHSYREWSDSRVYESKSNREYAADGSIRESDSAWTDGRLSHIGGSWTDASGRSLFSESRWLEMPENTWIGYQDTTAYTPGGQETEVISRNWSEGFWHPSGRILFTYDDAERVRSLEFFVGNGDKWIPSHDLRGQESSVTRAGGWGFDSGDPAMIFNGFDKLTFTYRPGVSEVEAITSEKPEHSTLEQNFPNPFNPTTTIPFTVAIGARTTIAIFDVLGREVARPVDAWKDPGEYRVEFDAKGLASGMYVCRFTSGTVSQTSKLMLVR